MSLTTPKELRKEWEHHCVIKENPSRETMIKDFEDWILGIQHETIEACADKAIVKAATIQAANPFPEKAIEISGFAELAAEIRKLKEESDAKN